MTLAVVAGLALGCEARIDDREPDDPATMSPDPVGAIELALTAVPTDAMCIQVIVEGPPNTRRQFDVSAGQVASFVLTGLPEGEKQVSARAFPEPCDQVRPDSVPTWATTEAVTVFVVPRRSVPVMLVLRPTGTVAATLTFDDSAVSVTPPMADFGAIAVGHTSAAATFTLGDVGKMGTGLLTAAIVGEDAADFIIVSQPCASLAPAQMCTLKVAFRPIAAGTRSAVLLLRTETGNTAGVTLTGRRLSPATPGASPVTHDFGTLAAGTMVSFFFTITNVGGTGTGPLGSSITSTSPGGNAFDVNGCVVFDLAPGASCQLEVVAKPIRAPSGTVEAATAAVETATMTLVTVPVQLTVR